MSKLPLSVAVGNYVGIRPLVDREVQIDCVDPVFVLQDRDEIFFRALRHVAFDFCELPLSCSVKTAAGTSAYNASPVFPSRAFRHTSIYGRTDRGINSPEDLKGKCAVVPEYHLRANAWVRRLLEEKYGVQASDVTWVRGGYEDPTRVEKITLNLPAGVRLEHALEGKTKSSRLTDGKSMPSLDREPLHASTVDIHRSNICSTSRTKSHQTGVHGRSGIRSFTRLESGRLAERYPWLPGTVIEAFEKSKALALARLSAAVGTKVTLPFVEGPVMYRSQTDG